MISAIADLLVRPDMVHGDQTLLYFFMAALCNRAGHIYFHAVFFSLLFFLA